MGIIQASIPLFFFLIGIELIVARYRGERVSRMNDSITDLSLGILSQLAGIALKLLTIGIYVVVERHLAVQHFLAVPGWPSAAPATPSDGFPWFQVHAAPLLSWIIVFLLVDLAYYWMHRCSHVVHLLWAGHVVHHSSEEYNLSVALRQSALHGLTSWIFYIPLALLGVPAVMFVVSYALNLVYQFWIHTRVIDRLGPLEWVLNTPSHHRVHHGVNPRYLDRNYAGVFIIWDRVFGTFEPESERPVYGLTTPLASWNPLWANVHVFVHIARTVRRTRSWRDRLQVIFGHPSWRPAELGGPVTPKPIGESQALYDPPLPKALLWYAVAQFVTALAAAFWLIGAAAALPPLQVLAGGFYIALALAGVGGVLERQRWALLLEEARLLTLLGAIAVLSWGGTAPLAVLGLSAILAAGSAAWLWLARSQLDARTTISGMLAA